MENPIKVVKTILGHFGIGKGEAAEPQKPPKPIKAGIEKKNAYPKLTQSEQLKRLDADEGKGKK